MIGEPPAEVRRRKAIVRWTNPVAPTGRLLCLPFAGGSAAIYRRWATWLPPDVQLLAVELPARGRRFKEPPCGDVATVVAGLADELAELDATDGAMPLVVFGHSLGGLLAYELARHLLGQGRPGPVALIASAAKPPQDRPERRAAHLADDELLAAVGRMGGTPPEVLASRELMDLVLPALRADLAMWESPRADPERLPVPIVVVVGDADRLATPADAQRWSACSDAVQVEVVAGGHFFITESPDQLAAIVGRVLRSCRGAG